jgi:hypothetical protein
MGPWCSPSRFRLLLVPQHVPTVYSREISRQITAPFTSRNFFSSPKYQPHRLQRPNASATKACISCTKGSLSASSRKLASFCSMVEQTPLSSEHYRNQVKPTARPPPYHGMKRQTTYIIVIDICSWRSKAARTRK